MANWTGKQLSKTEEAELFADESTDGVIYRALREQAAGMEEDMYPETVCGNCLSEQDVALDEDSGRRLCEPCRAW